MITLTKIVHAIHCCSIGGAEIFVKNLVLQTKKKYPEVDIEVWAIYSANELYNGDESAIEYEAGFIKELDKSGIKVVIMDKKKGIKGRFSLFRQIRNCYKKSKPQFIFCHLETVTFHIISSLFFKKVKIFETIHTNNISNILIHKFFMNFKLNKLITISNNVNNTVLSKLACKENKLHIIKNGINIQQYDVEREILSKKDINIVSIGRLIDLKNHMLLLLALKKIKDNKLLKDFNLKLKIYGDGVLKEELCSFVEKNNLSNCFIMGSTNDVPTVLKQADIYVLSSKIEGYSISLIEAMVSGIAIICTDVGGNSEIITNNKNGIIIESGNVNELCDALVRLVQDVELRKNFMIYSKGIKDTFSIEYTVDNYLGLCDIELK